MDVVEDLFVCHTVQGHHGCGTFAVETSALEKRKACMYFVGSSLKLAEHQVGFSGVCGFAEDAPVYCYNGVGAEQNGASRFVRETLYGCLGFFFCYPADIPFNALFGLNMFRCFYTEGAEGDGAERKNLFASWRLSGLIKIPSIPLFTYVSMISLDFHNVFLVVVRSAHILCCDHRKPCSLLSSLYLLLIFCSHFITFSYEFHS